MRLQLTKRADYAIRACLLLAMEERCPISSRRIAERMEIPGRFLPQVMGDLARAGIVAAVNGKHGGYCLRRDPASLSLLDVVEVVEGSGLRDEPVPGDAACDGRAACALNPVWAAAQAAFVDVLGGASLADLAARERAAHEAFGPLGPERNSR